MTIRFAAARRGDSPVLARMLCASVPLRAANDNSWSLSADELVQAALRHFALHGLGAAQQASENASAAFFAGDRQAYNRWLAICRVLDRRMAEAVAVHSAR